MLHKSSNKTTNQLPLYRTSAEVFYTYIGICSNAPRKLVKILDSLINTAEELLKGIALANEFKDNKEVKLDYINIAHSNVIILKTYNSILFKNNLISKLQKDKLNNLLKNISAQMACWSNSIREGHS